MSFKAVVVERSEDKKITAGVQTLEESQLPDGNVTIAVEYSTLNYKDGLCLGNSQGLVRNYPHVPGVDFAGTVESSEDDRYKTGDKVILTGWRVGEAWWGGYSQKAKVNADWLVPLPDGLTTYDAMAVGTAGFTAMQSIIALECHGLSPSDDPVLVTGASGGVGSNAIAILANLGYKVAAVSGRPETEGYLSSLGASEFIARAEINTKSERPLESEKWAGCIDSVGGEMLARIIGQMKSRSSIAAVGLVGGTDVPMSVMPFLLRGINLLGIDSVTQSYEARVETWARVAKDLPMEKLRSMITEATLSELPDLGKSILAGGVKGRVVVDVNAE
ncbi:MAG: acrylyl-CoA reductase (NADPH) [Saprospiraceae bacterium]|jgi:acrylyl-CoA reductase (NADPH)